MAGDIGVFSTIVLFGKGHHMNLLGALIGGVIGGVVGAAVWAGVAYGTGYQIGWIAWGVGLLCGLGVALGGKGEAAQIGGALAATLAIASILAGKYAVVEMLINKDMAPIQAHINEAKTPGPEDTQYWTHYIADQLVKQRNDAGQKVNWPKDVEPEDAEKESDYPPEIWKDAAARWKVMSVDDQAKFAQQASVAIDQEIRQLMADITTHVKKRGFIESFGLMDLLFGALAIGTAFRVGSGSMPSAQNR